MKGTLANGAHVESAARAVTQEPCTDAMTGVERALADILAEVLRIDRLSVEEHFFHELGADSLLMAKFCARVRKQKDLPSVSMKDIYRHPTIRSLAAAVTDAMPWADVRSAAPEKSAAPPTPISAREYI